MQDERTGFKRPTARTGQGSPQLAVGSISPPSELLAHQGTCSLAASAEVLLAPRAGSGDACPGLLLAPGSSSLSTLRASSPCLSLPLTFCFGHPVKLNPGALASAWLPEKKVRYSPVAALVACVRRWVPLGGRCPPSRAGRGRAGRGAPFC